MLCCIFLPLPACALECILTIFYNTVDRGLSGQIVVIIASYNREKGIWKTQLMKNIIVQMKTSECYHFKSLLRISGLNLNLFWCMAELGVCLWEEEICMGGGREEEMCNYSAQLLNHFKVWTVLCLEWFLGWHSSPRFYNTSMQLKMYAGCVQHCKIPLWSRFLTICWLEVPPWTFSC